MDFYIGNIYGGNKIGPYFLMGNAAGGFDRTTSRLPAEIVDLTIKFTSSALVDINKDGRLDLVLGTHADGYDDSWILLNDGAGFFSFDRGIKLPPGIYPLTVFILPIDLNRDGYPDLLLSQTPDYEGRAIQVLMNNRGKGFTDETSSRMPAGTATTAERWINNLMATDIDLDGSLDLISLRVDYHVNEKTPFIWLNNGTGHFAARNMAQLGIPVNSPCMHPIEPISVAVTDMNNDGVPDLVFLTDLGDAEGDYGTIGYDSFLQVPMPPVADFTAALRSGTAPLTVRFIDKSTRKITRWNWYFGDGATSRRKNPAHTFTVPGKYRVKLTVTGPGGSDTLTRYVLVSQPQ
jgi:hypothetical protein